VGSRPAPLYVVASPRPRAGRTLLARLLMEYAIDSGRALVGFDLSPREPTLAGRFPRLVWPVDIAETRGQMELFDRLLADTASIKVVDLGHGAFEQFFDVAGDIGFAQEAGRRGMDMVVFFIADRAMASVRVYAKLQARMPATFQPVHNKSVCLRVSAEDFPPTRPDCGFIRMPRLSQLVRGVVDRPGFSFNTFTGRQDNGPTEIHGWTADLYRQFRDFELRLLFGRLNASLGFAAPAPPPATARKGLFP
jgi:hypothetical protein